MKLCKKSPVLGVLLILAACGGGGGGDQSVAGSANVPPPSPPPGPVSTPIGTAGVFDVDYGQFRGVYTFLDNGQFYGLHFVSGSVLAGHPHGQLSANNSVTSMEAIAWANFIDDAGMVGAQEPNGRFGRTFQPSTLNVAISGSMGSFAASATQQKAYAPGSSKLLYSDPIPLSQAAGNYSGILRTVGIGVPQQAVSDFVIDAVGNFSVTGAGCTFTGTMARHGSTGIFDANVQTSGATCHLTASLKGIVTPLAVSNDLPQWGVQLNDASNVQTAVFIVTKH